MCTHCCTLVSGQLIVQIFCNAHSNLCNISTDFILIKTWDWCAKYWYSRIKHMYLLPRALSHTHAHMYSPRDGYSIAAILRAATGVTINIYFWICLSSYDHASKPLVTPWLYHESFVTLWPLTELSVELFHTGGIKVAEKNSKELTHGRVFSNTLLFLSGKCEGCIVI